MSDLINRKNAIAAWDKLSKRGRTEFDQVLMTLPSAEAKWIPVEWHYITDEEREENGYPKDWGVLMDCGMPLDEQEILVTTTSGRVEKDVCYLDGEFSLDSGWDWIDDILAWMPLPTPYKGGDSE